MFEVVAYFGDLDRRRCLLDSGGRLGRRHRLSTAAGRCVTLPGNRHGIIRPISSACYIFSLFELCGFLLGGFLLGKTGYELAGIVGAVPGGLLGAVVGRAIGRLPLLLAVKWVRRKLARKSSAQLRRELHDPGFGALNFNLLELKSRGEDVSCELPIVLDAARFAGSRAAGIWLGGADFGLSRPCRGNSRLPAARFRAAVRTEAGKLRASGQLKSSVEMLR